MIDPFLKCHRTMAPTLFESKDYLRSQNIRLSQLDPSFRTNVLIAHIMSVPFLSSSLFYSFQFRMVSPSITVQSPTNKKSKMMQEYAKKSTRYQKSIIRLYFRSRHIIGNYWLRFCDIQSNQGRGKGDDLEKTKKIRFSIYV